MLNETENLYNSMSRRKTRRWHQQQTTAAAQNNNNDSKRKGNRKKNTGSLGIYFHFLGSTPWSQ